MLAAAHLGLVGKGLISGLATAGGAGGRGPPQSVKPTSQSANADANGSLGPACVGVGAALHTLIGRGRRDYKPAGSRRTTIVACAAQCWEWEREWVQFNFAEAFGRAFPH